MQRPFTIDLGQLRALRAVREHGTVTAAAAAIHLTPSAVSQQIAALSRAVGAPLLARQGRRVRLTAQAGVLLEHGDRLHSQLERARADLAALADGSAGRVAVGAFASAISGLVAPALDQLRTTRPRLLVTVREMQAPQCFVDLDRGDLDVAVTVEWADGPHRDDPRYIRHHLLRDPLDMALPAAHPLAARTAPLRLDDLATEVWVAGQRGGPCVEVAIGACATAGFSPRIQHVTEDWHAVLALVRAGAGVALVPRLGLPRHPDGIAVRSLGPQGPARHIFAATRAGSEGSALLAPVLAALAGAAAHEEQREAASA